MLKRYLTQTGRHDEAVTPADFVDIGTSDSDASAIAKALAWFGDTNDDRSIVCVTLPTT